eukprot:sb/3473721/
MTPNDNLNILVSTLIPRTGEMDENPFADPNQVNPFMDPSVQQVSAQSTTVGAGLEDAMFSEPATVPVAPVITQPAPTYPASTTAPSYAPPSYPTTGTAGGYGSSNSFNSQPPRQYGNDENMKKQEDLNETVDTEVVQPEVGILLFCS